MGNKSLSEIKAWGRNPYLRLKHGEEILVRDKNHGEEIIIRD